MSGDSNAALVWQHFPIDARELPSTWAVRATGDVMSDIQSGFPSGKHHREATGVPHLRPMNVDRLGNLDLTDVKYVASDVSPLRVTEGHILFNNTNSPDLVGKTAYVGSRAELAFSNHMTRLRASEAVEPRFAAKYLHFLWVSQYFRHRCTNHVNQASVSGSMLADSVPFLIPPLAEQRRIIAALEEHLSDLDAAVAGLKRARANVLRHESSLLNAALSGANRISASWKEATVGDVAETVTGTTPPVADRKNYGGELPFFKPTDLNAGYMVSRAREHLTAAGARHARRLPVGSVLVTCIGATIGKTGLARVECATNQQINAAIPDTRHVTSEWLFWYFRSPRGQSGIKNSASATTLPILNKSKFAALVVPLPPIDEQRRIVAEIEGALSVAERTAAEINVQLARAARLRQSILKRAFEGKLVPQDPDDEPASALLERTLSESTPRQTGRRRVAVATR